MKPLSTPERRRRRSAIDAAMVIVILILMVQMWLLTATLESYLAGHKEAALSGAIISAVLFFASGGLYLFVGRIDRKSHGDR